MVGNPLFVYFVLFDASETRLLLKIVKLPSLLKPQACKLEFNMKIMTLTPFLTCAPMLVYGESNKLNRVLYGIPNQQRDKWQRGGSNPRPLA